MPSTASSAISSAAVRAVAARTVGTWVTGSNSFAVGFFAIEVRLSFFVGEVSAAFKSDGFLAFPTWLAAALAWAALGAHAIAGWSAFAFGAWRLRRHFCA